MLNHLITRSIPFFGPMLLLLCLACGNSGGLTIGEVTFADPGLQNCYEDSAANWAADDEDVSFVRGLDCGAPADDIRDLTGIEVLVGLEFLAIAKNKNLGSLEPILKLPSLIELDLRESNVDPDDLAIISQLTSLTSLDLDRVNDLGDVTSLSRLVHMEILYLQGAGITTGIASFVSMTKLVQGFFSSNPDSPCQDLSILRNALPSALIWPVEPQPGITCAP